MWDLFDAENKSGTGVCTADGSGQEWKHYLQSFLTEGDALEKIWQLEMERKPR